jgi:ABC-2 type transport system ATP-binding protein
MSTEPFVLVRDLAKRYGDTIALQGVSFEIARGEVFGLLGPNGAGKTTTLEIMEGLRSADAGTVHVAGFELPRQLDKLKQEIGVQLQTTSLYRHITVEEALALFASYYERALPVEHLLQLVALEEKRTARVKQLSGGQNQRLALALALVNDPSLVFLDEPTTGLDPQARQNLWTIVEKMKSEGRTVILTTHYMEEAERLADRVAVMDHGKIIAIDSPAKLIRDLGVKARIQCTVKGAIPESALASLNPAHPPTLRDGQLTVEVTDTQRALAALLEATGTAGAEIDNLTVEQANLEDVFLHLTGHHLRE